MTGNEAAAHGSQVTTLVLTPAIVKAVKIPVVAIGGFADGHGLAAALALGAEAIGMGTRLSMTKESPVHELTKKAQVDASIDDTLYSDRFDGLWCRVLKTHQSEKSIRQGINLFRAMIVGPQIAREMKLPLFKLMLGMLAQPQNMMKLTHMATAFKKIQARDRGGRSKERRAPDRSGTGHHQRHPHGRRGHRAHRQGSESSHTPKWER